MTFSVIIPAHNSAGFIRKALDSVKSQTYTDYELIVVCDACTDNTAEIAREYTDRVIEVDFANEGPTRNTGMDAAQGDWIVWIDDDDYWLHEYVLEEIASKLSDDLDMLCFSFIWKYKGYMAAADYVAVWTRCWRRSFITSMRFETDFPVDWPFYKKMKEKNGRVTYWDRLMYYYEFRHPGSQSDLHGL